MKLGQPIDLHLAPRYYQFNRAFAIRDAFDALVELITNCDDSYHRLFKRKQRREDGGAILIEYLDQRRNQPSFLYVYDRAEGMTLEEMKTKLGDVGTRQSEEGDRGFNARGAKDCTELGRMIVESIKDDAYYKCELTTKAQFVPWENGKKVNQELREKLHLPHGNGTAITLEIDPERKMPRFESILRDLPWHFALRDILSEESPTKALLRNLNQPNAKPEKLIYPHPKGELVFEESFEVADFPGFTAHLRIWKADESFDDPSERFRRSGIIVKGARAIHECSLLYPEFERDVLAKKYFGRLECVQIDQLLSEYDKKRESGESHPSNNPSLLIDPNRQSGLMREHPFTKSLFLIPSERLRALMAKDREAERSKQQQIANDETRNRLDRLARKASEFLKQQLEETEELGAGEDVDKSGFSKQGVLIFPTYLNVAVNEERTLTYYLKTALLEKNERIVVVESDDPAVEIIDAPFELRPHRKKDDRLIGTFRVRGVKLKDEIIIRATCGNAPKAEALANVIERKIEEHSFDEPLEFEYDQYRVREGSRKHLGLFAKYPDVVSEPTTVAVISSDSAAVPVRGTCRLVPVVGSNYAFGDVIVQGRKLNATSLIKASVNTREAVVPVKVVQKIPETGIQLKIELRDEDYGNFRARWADHEGKPNLLLVSARHKSLSRYLGPFPEYVGQNAPHFRVLLAEIVAESVCRKSLTLESKERTWEFRWADLKEDYLIADDVFAKLQQRIRDFVSDAHAIMLSDAEIR